MNIPRSIGTLFGVTLVIGSLLSPESLNAQQQGRVRTIKDFPELLKNERTVESVPRRGNQVRTAADYERAEAEQARLAASASQDQTDSRAAHLDPSESNGKKGANVVDTTRYRFSIPGPDLVRVAAQAGAVFTPEGGKPIKGGGNGAFQMPIHPGAMTSLAKGHVMNQLKPHDFWVIKSSSNRFHMFADAKGNPLQLRKGWTIQEVVLKGDNYKWLVQPKKGATSPYFVVELTAFHHANTIVEIAGAHLIGPPGVQDWQEAFIAPKRADRLPVKGRATAATTTKKTR